MNISEMSLLRQAVSDSDGQGDMAYLAIGALTITAILTLVFVCWMAYSDYHNCTPQTLISKGADAVTSVVPCRFDPLPLGQAAGLIFGAFSALIASLAGYMAATRKAPRAGPPQVNVDAPGATFATNVAPSPEPEAASFGRAAKSSSKRGR